LVKLGVFSEKVIGVWWVWLVADPAMQSVDYIECVCVSRQAVADMSQDFR